MSDDSINAAASAVPDFYSPASLSADTSVGFLMKRALSSIAQQVDRRLAEHDLTHAQWMPLYRLARLGGPSTLVALARELHLDPAAITRALDRLEAKGLVRRERSLTDRRVVQVALTDAGARVAELVPPVLTDELNRHLVGFSRAEWLTLLDLLQRLVANGDARREACACAAQAAAAGLTDPNDPS